MKKFFSWFFFRGDGSFKGSTELYWTLRNRLTDAGRMIQWAFLDAFQKLGGQMRKSHGAPVNVSFTVDQRGLDGKDLHLQIEPGEYADPSRAGVMTLFKVKVRRPNSGNFRVTVILEETDAVQMPEVR